MPGKHSILTATDLTIGYASKKKQQVIANEITIDLKQGKLVALLGKNGIGKSTLLRTLSKVQPKLAGEIVLNGIALEQLSAKALSQQISVVLTERIPESNLTVYELIALGRQPYTNWMGTLTEKDKEQIVMAIANTNINDLVHQRCDQLSDGQLQKVMIARALAQNTEIIILDEPTAHLDIHHKIEVFNLLKNLVEKFGKTIIISTHEIQLALQLANELWLMNDLEFVSGSTEQLIAADRLSSLFDSQFVKFDVKSKQFIRRT
ncbi:MAG: ABC transporter ATP-binding protein [Flavobacteriaceae bacterium]|nr:ABC transporter ATP-binding protein [Flavobacteriaceae bacterium]